MHEVLVNRLGGLSLPRKSVVRLTDRPDMTLDVDVKQQHNNNNKVRLEISPQSSVQSEVYPFDLNVLRIKETICCYWKPFVIYKMQF